MKSISIVIVTWNCKKFIAECLDSLADCRRDPSTEIVVVDNGSSDGTQELLRTNYPDVVFIQSKENLGFARANNLGICRTSGRYVCLINPDVQVLDGCLEKMTAYMDAHTDVGMIGPKMLGSDGTPGRSYMGEPTLWRLLCRALALDSLFPNVSAFSGFLMFYLGMNQVADVDILNGWFWMTRREALEKVGPLDERFFMYGEDLDWSRRFRQSGWRVTYFPEAEAVHFGGGSSAKAPVRFSVEMQRANYQYWSKYHGVFSRFVYRGVVAFHVALRLFGYLLVDLVHRSDKSDARLKVRASLASLRWVVGITPSSSFKPRSENRPEAA